jgi:hypothetical protein
MKVNSTASINNAAQEAMETTAQTKAEATKGDQQAVRLLARREAANNVQNVQQPPQNTKGGLDVKA